MIILHSVRQQTALLVRICHHTRPSYLLHIRRQYHFVPPLTHDTSLRASGLPGVFSRNGYDQAWTRYQASLVAKLNELTQGTSNENRNIKQLLLLSARDASQATLFNYASMAWNNFQFFQTICPDPKPIPKDLVEYIDGSFSSLDSFRTTFLHTADAMFGPGYVWLVKQNSGPSKPPQNLAILTTYIAGSPLPGAHYRKQPVDTNTLTTNVPRGMAAAQYAKQYAGTFGSHSTNEPKLAPGGVELEILLCVNTWQHVWMFDHGVTGKRRFLEAWWEKIDWDVVYSNATWTPKPSFGWQGAKGNSRN